MQAGIPLFKDLDKSLSRLELECKATVSTEYRGHCCGELLISDHCMLRVSTPLSNSFVLLGTHMRNWDNSSKMLNYLRSIIAVTDLFHKWFVLLCCLFQKFEAHILLFRKTVDKTLMFLFARQARDSKWAVRGREVSVDLKRMC